PWPGPACSSPPTSPVPRAPRTQTPKQTRKEKPTDSPCERCYVYLTDSSSRGKAKSMTQTQEAATTVDNGRTRTYTWSDPHATAAGVGRLSGIEMLQAIERNELPPPPIMHTLDLDGFELLGEGRCAFLMRAQEFHYNPLGTVHGGVIAT